MMERMERILDPDPKAPEMAPGDATPNWSGHSVSVRAAGVPDVVVLLLGFGLRVCAITRQSLWTDEVYSYTVSQWPLARVWRDLVHDHVPLYTIVLGWWQAAAGPSELSLRYFSALCSVAMLPLLIVLGRRLLPPVPLYLAVLLVAISPFQLYFAQEVVAYSFLGLLALLVTWLFLTRLGEPSTPVLLIAGVLYAALFYTHYAGFFVLATDVAIAGMSVIGHLAQRRPGRCSIVPGRPHSPSPLVSPRWAIAWALGIGLFLPWAIPHVGVVGDNLVGGTTRSVPSLLGTTFTDLTFGPVFTDHLDAGKAPDAQVLRNLALAALLVPLACGLALLPSRRAALAFRWANLVALLHAAVPFAALLVLVQFSREFVSRYGFPAAAWVPVVVVLGLGRLPPPARWIGILALFAFSAWGDVIYVEHPGFARLDFRAAVADIVDHRAPGDAVVITAPYVASTFAYYADPRDHTSSPLPTVALPEAIPMDPAATRAALARVAAVSPRVWLLRWQDYYADPRGVIAGWLGANGYALDGWSFPGGIAIDLWATRPPLRARLPPTARSTERTIDGVHLVGYEATSTRADRLTLDLYWRLDAPLADDYTVFVHLDSPDGRTVARADSRPDGGRFPTDRWPVGPLVRDVHPVPLTPCLPAGRYNVSLGFYVLKTMRRLGVPGRDTIRVPLDLQRPPAPATPGLILRRLPAALRLDTFLPDPPASCPP